MTLPAPNRVGRDFPCYCPCFGLIQHGKHNERRFAMNTENNQSTEDKRPTHTLFATQTIEGQEVKIRVGVAWKHKKGEGFNVALDNLVAFANKKSEQTTETN